MQTHFGITFYTWNTTNQNIIERVYKEKGVGYITCWHFGRFHYDGNDVYRDTEGTSPIFLQPANDTIHLRLSSIIITFSSYLMLETMVETKYDDHFILQRSYQFTFWIDISLLCLGYEKFNMW